MSDCVQFMARHGVADAGGLASFVERFLDDPAIIYTMGPEELAHMEDLMDEALDLLVRTAKGDLNNQPEPAGRKGLRPSAS